ncbi:MAG: PCP reductase family protein [Nitrospirae bacterium]|nr:PCP reductase family protein [Nitrospirota bacterium]
MAEPTWTPEAEALMARVPFFVRGIARKAVLKAAEAEGVTEIDPAFVARVRAKTQRKGG